MRFCVRSKIKFDRWTNHSVEQFGSHGGKDPLASDQGSSKYADLDQITKDTVASLKTVWIWDSHDNKHIEADSTHSPAGYKRTPITIGNALYTSTSLGFVAAIDATTGTQKWVFDTRTWADGRPANMGFNHRGVAYWTNGTKRRILIGTNNGYLWSWNADTGFPDKTFGDVRGYDVNTGEQKWIFHSIPRAGEPGTEKATASFVSMRRLETRTAGTTVFAR